MHRRVLSRLILLLTLLALTAAGIYAWGYAVFTGPGPLTSPRVVLVPRGAGLEEIARSLRRDGVITHPIVFVAAAQLLNHGQALKAGEFRVPAGASPREVMAILREGKTVVRRFAVVEGLTVREVVERLRSADGLTGDIDGLPEEGSLLPETYHFSHGDSRAGLIRRMQDAMRKTLGELWEARSPDLPFDDPRSALILASIVERETGLAAERPLVASVFVNRLRRGMRLQSDPTVAYAVAPAGLGRPLTKRDLATDNPYNTYRHGGLPPGPIANPGRAAIEAALHPAPSSFLYFVAKDGGGHAFARTLAEHNRNVARWRRYQRQRKN